MPDDGYEPLTAEDGAKDLLGVDETTFRRALLRAKLIVLFAQCGIGERLVRDGDLLEPVLGVGVISILVWMKFNRKPS